MNRKQLVLSLTGLLFGLAAAGATVWAQGGVTAHAHLHPVNKSKVKGNITFTQTAEGLMVTGAATGLVGPSEGRYVSLVYDTGSVPGGPEACEPTVILPDMFVGIWTVDAAGNGVLIQTAQPAPLGTFDTMSIRDTTINGGFGPQAVVACGQVAVNP